MVTALSFSLWFRPTNMGNEAIIDWDSGDQVQDMDFKNQLSHPYLYYSSLIPKHSTYMTNESEFYPLIFGLRATEEMDFHVLSIPLASSFFCVNVI